MVWVLSRSYKLPKNEISRTVIGLLVAENVVTDSGAIEAGLKAMEAGADFADGVIDYEGRWLGGETFVSFDKKAVAAIAKQGTRTKLLA
jgi:predicted nucleic-acid-binding protein